MSEMWEGLYLGKSAQNTWKDSCWQLTAEFCSFVCRSIHKKSFACTQAHESVSLSWNNILLPSAPFTYTKCCYILAFVQAKIDWQYRWKRSRPGWWWEAWFHGAFCKILYILNLMLHYWPYYWCSFNSGILTLIFKVMFKVN